VALSKTQEALIAKLRASGAGELGVELDDATCNYLVAVIARDLSLIDAFPEVKGDLPPFFGELPLSQLRLPGANFRHLIDKLFTSQLDADAYFYCLATLHKARLKYERILQAQPIPTIDQVGPRGLLQYGSVTSHTLAGFLFWRKWIYDIDNRAAQETGYVFQPIIAHAVGGVTVSAAKSPVKRGGRGSGRQVDCIRFADKRAYEIKLRVTIAASGQGRWSEEMDFPMDCKASGYAPVLIVLDPTPNPKLTEITAAFRDAGGETYVGDWAWAHLEALAGRTMGTFLKKYVHDPMDSLLREAPDNLPDMLLQVRNNDIVITVGTEELRVTRNARQEVPGEPEPLPPDADEHLGGP
jgi:hypothetical protein